MLFVLPSHFVYSSYIKVSGLRFVLIDI